MAKASTKTKTTKKKVTKKVARKKTSAAADNATTTTVEELEEVENQSEPQSEETNTMTETAEITKPISQQQGTESTTGKTNKAKSINDETHAKYEEIKKGELHITDLQKMTVEELHDMAKKEGLTEYTGLKKQELTFRIIKERIRQNGLMYGEGVLELLPDGFGFLRTPDYNYMPCPDDIYVSPSQIRRFGLRNGNIVAGQIRPPKESEKYFALLRVEMVNYEDPESLTEKVVFEDLTPLHPEGRFILETVPEEINMRIIDVRIRDILIWIKIVLQFLVIEWKT